MWPFGHNWEITLLHRSIWKKQSIWKGGVYARKKKLFRQVKLNFNLIHLIKETDKNPSFAGHALLLGENIKTFLLLRSELEHGTKNTMDNCKQKFLKRNCTDLFVIYLNISFYQMKNVTLKFICCLCEEHDFRKIADHFRAIY